MAALAGVATAGLTILKDFFEINATSVDNWTFKLFYKWSTVIFVFSRFQFNNQPSKTNLNPVYASPMPNTLANPSSATPAMPRVALTKKS